MHFWSPFSAFLFYHKQVVLVVVEVVVFKVVVLVVVEVAVVEVVVCVCQLESA